MILSDLSPVEQFQDDLFTKIDQRKSTQVMQTMDAINHLYGANTLMLASTGATTSNPRHWRMRANHKSQRFTTRWNEIPKVNT